MPSSRNLGSRSMVLIRVCDLRSHIAHGTAAGEAVAELDIDGRPIGSCVRNVAHERKFVEIENCNAARQRSIAQYGTAGDIQPASIGVRLNVVEAAKAAHLGRLQHLVWPVGVGSCAIAETATIASPLKTPRMLRPICLDLLSWPIGEIHNRLRRASSYRAASFSITSNSNVSDTTGRRPRPPAASPNFAAATKMR